MRRVFDHPVSDWEAAKQLLQLCEGSCSVAEYDIASCTLATENLWNQETLIKDELALRDLNALLHLSIWLDN